MIWDKERTYNELPPLTETVVQLAQQQLGVVLPSTYLQQLTIQNGGTLLHNAFPTTKKNSWADDHVQIEELYGIADGEGILQTAYLVEEWGLPQNLVLIGGDGHSWFALDYRQATKNPPVVYIEADEEVDIQLADSFEQFIAQLFTYEEA